MQADHRRSSMRYSLSLLGGLEDIVRGEIGGRLPAAQVVGERFGRILIDYDGPVQDITRLRTIENVIAWVGEFDDLPASRDGLEVVSHRCAQMDFTRAGTVHDDLHGRPAHPTFRVSGERRGQHEYNSQEVAAAAGAGIQPSHDWAVDLKGYHYEVIAQVDGHHCSVGLRLTKTALHKRSRAVGGLAALNPTLAHAMALLSEPVAGETVLDPMCGAGTVLIERHEIGHARLIGSDLFEAAMTEARINTRAASVPAHLIQADARHMPYPTGSIDVVISNPPWGRRVLAHRSMWRLYHSIFGEIERVLRPGGRAVILTLQRRLMQDLAAKITGLETVHDRLVSVGGMKPHLYVLRRT